MPRLHDRTQLGDFPALMAASLAYSNAIERASRSSPSARCARLESIVWQLLYRGAFFGSHDVGVLALSSIMFLTLHPSSATVYRFTGRDFLGAEDLELVPRPQCVASWRVGARASNGGSSAGLPPAAPYQIDTIDQRLSEGECQRCRAAFGIACV